MHTLMVIAILVSLFCRALNIVTRIGAPEAKASVAGMYL